MNHLSTGELIAACRALGLSPISNRKDHLLAALAASGYTPGAIDAAARSQVSTPAAVGANVDAIVDAAVSQSESRITARLDAAAAAFKKLGGEVQSLRGDLASVTVPESQIATAIAAAFAPLRAAFEVAPVDVQARVAAVAPRERRPIADVFDLPGVEGDCEVWGPPGQYDPDYVWHVDHLRLALLALETGENIWLAGERGTGKTQFAANLAARLGRPFFRVSFDANMDRSEFIGADGLASGSTQWQDGQVLQAYRTPGAICLLDECSAIRPEFATTLHALLEQSSVYTVTSTGEVVHRAHGMAFIAADNTNGCGDETGRYAGTRAQNAALVDRFGFSLRITFLDPVAEAGLLVKRGADAETARKIIRVYTACRAEVGGLLVEPPSLRAAFAFCKAVKAGIAPHKAWEVSVVNKSPAVSAEALDQLFTAHWEV